jgi:hypothetical protein
MGSLVTLYEWNTPCSGYQPESVGKWHIKRRELKAGSTLTVEAMSMDAILFPKTVTITVLREGERDKNDTESVWMSDTPMEYYKGWELVARSHGNVLVGGLGLGLFVHLLYSRKDIGKITVIEKSPEVIQLVSKYLPKDVEIICGDFMQEIQKLEEAEREFDTVIADMWKNDTEEELISDCRDVMDEFYPCATHLFWAVQGDIDDENSRYAILSLKGEELERFKNNAMDIVRG